MSKIPGTNIAATIVPFDSEDTYATHIDTYGQGGWRAVVDIAERDAIPQDRRKIGMAVYVQETDSIYILKEGTSNLNWRSMSGESGTTYIHNQGTASEIWLIQHDMNKRPSVIVVDSADTVVEGEVQYLDDNRILVKFNGAFKGKAYCN